MKHITEGGMGPSPSGSWTRTSTCAALMLAALASCGRSSASSSGAPEASAPAASAAASWSTAVQAVAAPIRAQLDSGTAAYRAGRFQDARDHYQRATEMNPHVAASWFGVFMAASKLGDSVQADTAFRRARTLDPSLAGATAHMRSSPHDGSPPASPHGNP